MYLNWSWLTQKDVSAQESIFVLELRSVIAGIKANGVRNCVLVIIIDNTAAASVLRSMYSSTQIGRELIRDLHLFLTEINIFLVPAGIAGADNDADSPTRGNHLLPDWCSNRLTTTW